MKKYTPEELRVVLEQHKLWLSGKGGAMADLYGADLYGADLREADLREADLRRADLGGADLRRAKLEGAILPDFRTYPEEGEFIGWKKTQEGVVKLLILDAKQVSGGLIGRKLRTKSVKVLETPENKPCKSMHDKNFIYNVGDILTIEDFTVDSTNECASGIHFFMTRKEAENY